MDIDTHMSNQLKEDAVYSPYKYIPPERLPRLGSKDAVRLQRIAERAQADKGWTAVGSLSHFWVESLGSKDRTLAWYFTNGSDTPYEVNCMPLMAAIAGHLSRRYFLLYFDEFRLEKLILTHDLKKHYALGARPSVTAKQHIQKLDSLINELRQTNTDDQAREIVGPIIENAITTTIRRGIILDMSYRYEYVLGMTRAADDYKYAIELIEHGRHTWGALPLRGGGYHHLTTARLLYGELLVILHSEIREKWKRSPWRLTERISRDILLNGKALLKSAERYRKGPLQQQCRCCYLTEYYRNYSFIKAKAYMFIGWHAAFLSMKPQLKVTELSLSRLIKEVIDQVKAAAWLPVDYTERNTALLFAISTMMLYCQKKDAKQRGLMLLEICMFGELLRQTEEEVRWRRGNSGNFRIPPELEKVLVAARESLEQLSSLKFPTAPVKLELPLPAGRRTPFKVFLIELYKRIGMGERRDVVQLNTIMMKIINRSHVLQWKEAIGLEWQAVNWEIMAGRLSEAVKDRDEMLMARRMKGVRPGQ